MPDITFNRTTTLKFPGSQIADITTGIVNGSLVIREILCSDRLAFGDINSNQFQCQLYNCPNLTGKKIQVVQNDNGTNKTLFTGWVDSCKTDDLSGFKTIVAYDYFYKSRKKKIKAWWKSYWASRDQSTLGAMWKNLLTYYNIPYTNTDLICDSLVVKKKEMKKIKTSYLSTFLTKLCEINLCVPNISRSGVLEFVQFIDTEMVAGDAIDIRGDYTISKSKFEDYAITPYNKIELYDKNNELCAEAGSGTNILVIQNNEFLFNQSEVWLDEIANLMLSKMFEFNYIPANITMKVSDLDIHIGNLVRTQKGLCLVCENNYSGSLLVNQEIISNNQSEYDEPNAGTKLGDTPIRDAERIDFNIDEKSSIISGPEFPTAGYGKDGDIQIMTTPPIKIERHINSFPYWYATQLKQNSNGNYDIVVTGYSDSNDTPINTNGAIFKAIGFGGAGTYHISCKMQFEGYINAPWGDVMGLYLSYDDSGVYFSRDSHFGQLVTTMYQTFLLNMYFDNNEHEYSFDFYIDENHASHIVNKTMYLTVVVARCWKYENTEPVGHAEGTLRITGLSITGENVIYDPDIIGLQANIDGNWKNIDYVDKVSQTQGSTGGTEIAEINNTNGTKTKIYQKTVEANPTGTPTEVLSSLTIGETLYELGGGNVDDVKVDDVSVVTDKIANIYTMTGATAGEAGTKGLVPAPASGDNEKYLRGDGTWAEVQGGGGGVIGDGVYSEKVLWQNPNGISSHTTIELSDQISKYDAIYIVTASNAEPTFRNSQIIPVSAIDKSGNTHFGVFDTGANTYYYSVLTYVDETHLTLGEWGSSYHILYYKIVGINFGTQSPIIYSLEEREIGVWTDGKPLYQKTIVNNNGISSTETWTEIADIGNTCDIKLVDGKISTAVGEVPFDYYGQGSNVSYIANMSASVVKTYGKISAILNSGANWLRNLPLTMTVQYTKSTDVAGSGKYAELGVPAVHYDDTERVIGTWFGKPLYQKTIEYSSNFVYDGSFANRVDVSALNIENLVNGFGFYNRAGQTQLQYPFGGGVRPEGQATYSVSSRLYNGNLEFAISSNYSDINKICFTIQYTKTTD